MKGRGRRTVDLVASRANRVVVAWKRGAEILPGGLLGCVFTCAGSTIANACYADWVEPLQLTALRFTVGLAGACCVGLAVLPLLHTYRKRRLSDRSLAFREVDGA
jgi:hypothetical protein